MKKADIVVCGSLNYDFVMPTAHLPQKGETVMGRQLRRTTGGKGANQALQAGRLGADVRMIGSVGSDFMGDAQMESLCADHVDVRFVKRDARAGTGSALILVDDAGDNCIVVSPGANATCDRKHIDDSTAAFTAGAILLVQCEIPVDTIVYAIKKARQTGMKVILDPAPTVPLPDEIWALADIVKPNETEAAYHSGVALEPDMKQWVKKAAAALKAKGAANVLITLGGEGSYYTGTEGEFFTPAFPIHPVDTTAAGDSYAGALAVALGEGIPMQEALRFAAAAGALTASKAGAQPSLPSRTELDAFLQVRK